MASKFYRLFPDNRKHLIGTISGSSIIDEMSTDEFRTMIIECLTGRNPRIHTENWAQSRVFHGVFTGIHEMYDRGKKSDPDFITQAPQSAAECLRSHHTSTRNSPNRLIKEDMLLCQWVCNLTSKGWDNILHANSDNLTEWGKSVIDSITSVPYGGLERNIINTTIYNASLAKKGGLKSAMGNLFEPLLLYSSLSACGLKFVNAKLMGRAQGPCFTLDVNEGRQADAQIKTGIKHPSKIDIDIGFIGKGNPEIIADKTQRFGNMVGGGQNPLEHTIIIVSAIPETKRAQLVVRQAKALGAKVIPMSQNNWVQNLSVELVKLGVPGITKKIPEHPKDARKWLHHILQSSTEIVDTIPRNLEVPDHWD